MLYTIILKVLTKCCINNLPLSISLSMRMLQNFYSRMKAFSSWIKKEVKINIIGLLNSSFKIHLSLKITRVNLLIFSRMAQRKVIFISLFSNCVKKLVIVLNHSLFFETFLLGNMCHHLQWLLSMEMIHRLPLMVSPRC